MKRTLSIMLAGALALSMLMGCDSKKQGDQDSKKSVAAPTPGKAPAKKTSSSQEKKVKKTQPR